MDKKVLERRRLVNRERGRRRAGPIFLLVLAVIAAVAFVYVRSSSVFAVQTVTASSTRHITQEQIAKAVADARGASLLKVSTASIEKDLAGLPYVRSIHVYRDFPHALEVRIEEYEPAARVQSGDGPTWLVADDGRLLQKADTAAQAALPLIVAAARFEVKAGQVIPQAVLRALPVADMLEQTDIASRLPGVDHITVSQAGSVVVLLEEGTELRLGEPTGLKQKMMLAAQLIQQYLKDGKSLEYVDTSAGDRVAVKPK
jgi:cell division septal protein FtsQ